MNYFLASKKLLSGIDLTCASITAFFLSFLCIFTYAYWLVEDEIQLDAQHVLYFAEHKIAKAIDGVKTFNQLPYKTCDQGAKNNIENFLYQHASSGLFLIRNKNALPWHFCSLIGSVNFQIDDKKVNYINIPSDPRTFLSQVTYNTKESKTSSALFLTYFGKDKVTTVKMPSLNSYSFFEPDFMSNRKVVMSLTNGETIFSVGSFNKDDVKKFVTKSKIYPIVLTSSLDLHRVWKKLYQLFILFVPLYVLFLFLCLSLIKSIFKVQLSVGYQLYNAVKKKELCAFYQPIVDVKTGTIIGAEALVRWKKNNNKIISPTRFIEELEKSQLIFEVTNNILKNMPIDLKQVLVQSPAFKCSINLIPEHLENDEFYQQMQKMAQADYPCKQLAFEITERLPLRNLTQAHKNIKILQSLGITFELDDSGTGYGGASYLHKLPINVMKIDKLFVDSIILSPNKTQVLDAYISMAKNLDMDIIAEGVETMEQSKALLKKGVKFQQGYLFSKPLSADEFVTLWQENHCKKQHWIMDGFNDVTCSNEIHIQKNVHTS